MKKKTERKKERKEKEMQPLAYVAEVILPRLVTSARQRRDPCSGARFSKVPVTFRARNQIFKSKY